MLTCIFAASEVFFYFLSFIFFIAVLDVGTLGHL
jgi:hypothetical protein